MKNLFLLVLLGYAGHTSASQQNSKPSDDEIRFFFWTLNEPNMNYVTQTIEHPEGPRNSSLFYELLEKYSSFFKKAKNPQQGYPTLTAAALGWRPAEFEKLLQQKMIDFDPNVQGDTPLDIAITNRDYQKIKLLVQYGMKIDQPDSNGLTPLINAARRNDSTGVLMLLFLGANPNYIVQEGRYAGETVYDFVSENPSIVKAFKKYEENKNASEKVRESIVEESIREGKIKNDLDIAFYSGDMEKFKEILLKNKHLINEYDSNYWTPLMRASMTGNVEIIKFLLKNGAQIDKFDNNQKTALMYAALNGRKQVFALLLQLGANPYIEDIEHKTALDQIKSFYPQILQDAVIQKALADNQWTMKRMSFSEAAAKQGARRQKDLIASVISDRAHPIDSNSSGIIAEYMGF